ncbi:DegT/DnrJ/EryC1/StrS family aminotransferase [Phocaeicola sp.]
MKIEKIALEQNYQRTFYYYERARDGFSYLLSNISHDDDGIVLLPSFIGWSCNEGSGVFDPVRESGLKYDFYAMDEQLHIDVDDLYKKLANSKVVVFVIIHYYGHIDPQYTEIIDLVRKYDCIILEDEAHALYSDLIDGICGRSGDAFIFSLHKMLPCRKGGVLGVINETILPRPNTELALDKIFCYDLWAISQKRKENVNLLFTLIRRVDGVRSLWHTINQAETLQTFPVIIKDVDRDILYEKMNDNGFGVVSLYHTLIPEIDKEKYAISYELSKRIMNLPVHQDADSNEIIEMCEKLQEIILKLREDGSFK